KGNDVLNGGLGADTLIGGLGDDFYVVDDSKDVVSEAANQGRDVVQSSITFSLAALANVEDVFLVGINDIDATGNAGSNTLIGNDGSNRLDGGKGVDLLIGGNGNDVYFIDDVKDTVVEDPGTGIDTIVSALAIDLGEDRFKNVENATLIGTAAVNLKGNDAAN